MSSSFEKTEETFIKARNKKSNYFPVAFCTAPCRRSEIRNFISRTAKINAHAASGTYYVLYARAFIVLRQRVTVLRDHFVPRANDLSHAKREEEQRATRGIGYGVPEASVFFVIDAILESDLCDIEVHITAEIENPKKHRSPPSLSP